MPPGPVFVTGASGHVGSRLVDALRARGTRVRALTRSAPRLEGRDVDVVEGDVRDAASLAPGLAGAAVAYYLVHSLGSTEFGDEDRDAAHTFAAAAADAGVGRIVYLSGLGRGELSPHLESRQEVGRILRESAVPTVELRASIVIGEGSASFEAFRLLVDLFPAVVVPDWARNPSQPIAIDDVVAYLVEAAEIAVDGSAVYEIGGRDRVPYVAVLEEYARRADKSRAISTVPAPAALAGLAAATKPLQPDRARVVSDLFESLRVDTSVHERDAAEVFTVAPRGLVEAIAAAA